GSLGPRLAYRSLVTSASRAAIPFASLFIKIAPRAARLTQRYSCLNRQGVSCSLRVGTSETGRARFWTSVTFHAGLRGEMPIEIPDLEVRSSNLIVGSHILPSPPNTYRGMSRNAMDRYLC